MAELRGSGRCDPDLIVSHDEFCAALRVIKDELSYTEILARSRNLAASAAIRPARDRWTMVALPKGTVSGVLAGRNLPSVDVLVSLLRVLGVVESEISRWVAALERVRSRRAEGASAPAGPVGVVGRRSVGQQAPGMWLLSGAEGVGHFKRRAMGQRSHARGGDLFRGRLAALAAVRGWLTAAEAPGRPLVITGQPGAGKSAVLARAALGLQAERVGPGLAFHGRDATHAEVLAAVADLTGARQAASREELLDALAGNAPTRPWLIALDALDEAVSTQDRLQIAETLTELAALPEVRVAVATRPLATSDRERYLPGGLLAALGVASPKAVNLVDLDIDRYFAPAGLEQFAAALLAQDGVEHPSPPGAAWTRYRSDPRLRDRLALVIAGRAGRNYLVAAMAAVPLSTAEAPVDPAAPGFDPEAIASGVGEALSKYLNALPQLERARTRGLLSALAYARGAGIDDQMWRRFAAALGYPAEVIDLDQLRTTTAADYLLQTTPGDKGRVTTRLFHQALADELLAARHRPSDERQLVNTLLSQVDTAGSWAQSPNYTRRHVAEHAAVASELPLLIDDAHYLAVADFTRLLPLLATPQLAQNPMAAVVRQVGPRATSLPPSRRARLLALTAAHLGLADIQRRLAVACIDGVRPLWVHTLGGVAHQELIGHTGWVCAVALGRVGNRDVIVSADTDGTVRVWDAVTGQPRGSR